MGSSGLLLVLACCAGLCWAQQPTWEWPCDPVTAQEDVDIDKIVGVWYMIKKIPNSELFRCVTLRIHRGNASDTLHANISAVLPPVVTPSTMNGTIVMISPSKWYIPALGTQAVVVDSSADGATFTFSGCERTNDERRLNTYVFRKSPGVDLGPVEARLTAAGVVGVDEATTEDIRDCSAGFT